MTTPEKPEKQGLLEGNWGWIALVVTAVAILIPGLQFGPLVLDEKFVDAFRGFAVWAAVIAALAALCRLLAHRGNVHLDGLGKALGFSSALLALFATVVLSKISF